MYLGTYFNCIMFMVASSVVTTIMILNYHHRLADTHEMPPWVNKIDDFLTDYSFCITRLWMGVFILNARQKVQRSMTDCSSITSIFTFAVKFFRILFAYSSMFTGIGSAPVNCLAGFDNKIVWRADFFIFPIYVL